MSLKLNWTQDKQEQSRGYRESYDSKVELLLPQVLVDWTPHPDRILQNNLGDLLPYYFDNL